MGSDLTFDFYFVLFFPSVEYLMVCKQLEKALLKRTLDFFFCCCCLGNPFLKRIIVFSSFSVRNEDSQVIM